MNENPEKELTKEELIEMLLEQAELDFACCGMVAPASDK